MENEQNSRPALIGQKISDIEFEAFHENEIKNMKFSDFKGKWQILFFYPADFTFVCPTELEDMAEIYADFQKAGAEVISFSTDTVFAHKAWHDSSDSIKKIKFPMASDPTGKICKSLGTYIDDEGLSLRGSFIIDPDGVVKAYEIHDNSIGRSAKELLRKLHAAIFVRENGDKVCPANWHPGNDTLTPGLDLVGKI
jgi:NADH-dependent peroxiredoxin subunit C